MSESNWKFYNSGKLKTKVLTEEEIEQRKEKLREYGRLKQREYNALPGKKEDNAAWQREYREKNREAQREYIKLYQREYRAKLKAKKLAKKQELLKSQQAEEANEEAM